MPSWKKVITSGSNAQLNQITASGFNLVGTGTAELEVDGHITASGDISASGNIILGNNKKLTFNNNLNSMYIDSPATNQFDISIGNTRRVSVTGATFLTSTANNQLGGHTSVDGNITASGNISASGNLHADVTTQTNLDKLVTYDTSTGQFHITASSAFMGSGGGGSTNAAGSDTQVQFNDGGTNFGGDAGLVFNKTSNLLTVGAITSTGDITANGNITGDNNTNITGISNITTLSTSTFGNASSDTHTFTGNITASGNISASGGTITANIYKIGQRGAIGILNNDIAFASDSNITTIAVGKSNDNTPISLHGNITASENISSSGVVSGQSLKINNTTAIDDAGLSNPSFRIGAFGGFNDYRGSANFEGPVTASQTISASGNISTDNDFRGMSENSQIILGHQTPNSSFVKAQISEHSDGVTPVSMDFLKSRGTLASPSAVQQSDFTGTQRYFGHDGSSYRLSAAIRGDIDSGATIDTNVMPGSLNFLTTTNGSLNSRMFIASTGNIGIGTGTATSLPPKTLTVEGDISGSGELIIGNIESNTYISASNGTLEISGSGRGQLEVDYRLFNTGSTHLSAAGGAQGDIVKFGGTSTTAGKIYMYNTDHTWVETQANTVSRSTGSLAVALGSNSTTDGMLLRGYVKLKDDVSTAVGQPIFLSNNAIGAATGSAPAGSGNVVRVIGYYFGNSGQVYFNPDNTTIVVA